MRMDRGALEAQPLFSEASKSLFSPQRRRKINCIAIFLNVFLPWVHFVFLFYLTSFKMYYKHPFQVWVIVGVTGFGVVALCAMLARSEHKGYTGYWYKFATLQFGVAVTAAVALGITNFYTNLLPFYDWERLKTYVNINPSMELGQNMLDSGTVYWSEGTSIDLTRAWHFMSDKVKHGIHRYCVAPIINGGNPESGTFDFWAVGLDCCSSAASDFRCGSFASGTTRASLRLFDDEARPYYKLAIQQAEAQYKYKSKHPVLFEWVQDPLDRIQQFFDRGVNMYLVAVCASFCTNVVSVAFATFRFAWIGRAPASVV